jgi:hypothetical protein
MKRMYIALAIISVVMIGAVVAIGQTVQTVPSNPSVRQPFDRAKRRMELREEMHRRMRAKLFQGQGPDQDLFKDLETEIEDAMSDSFADMDEIKENYSNFKSEWSESKEGRVLTLTPQSAEQKLNIDVNASVITIKGDSVQKTATSSVSTSFSNSFPVPGDCDGSKVKMSQKDGKIVMLLPFRSAPKEVKVPAKEERKPLPPSAGDVEI